MNKKQKILTILGLTAFGLIIFFHYCDPWFNRGHFGFGVGGAWHGGRYHQGTIYPLIDDVRMPLFVLFIVYTGLFFLFAGKDTVRLPRPPRQPRNWRRIIGVTFIGLLLAGLTCGITLSNEYQQEQERKRNEYQQQQRKALEAEESKHRISVKEIDLIGLRLGRPRYGGSTFDLEGQIRNRSTHNSTLNSITLMVTMRGKGLPDILGRHTVQIDVYVPANQTRGISTEIFFPNLPEFTQPAWEYYVTEIRGSKGI
jgi:hypothetical protein